MSGNAIHRRSHRSVASLADAGLIADERRDALERVAQNFAVSVTADVADLIDTADPHDPIASQYLPDARELDWQPHELADPIGDAPHTPVKGIVHRYPDRVLLKLLQICAVYCRFCFRREMVGPAEGVLTPDEIERAISYIAGNPDIWEVILTGGDPLLLDPRRLAEIRTRIDAIPHVGVLRIHTRIPVADPARITDDLVDALKGGRAPVFVLLHANHAREFSDAARAAIARLVDAGIPLLGQSVLLAGINDSSHALTDLFRTMVVNRVKPHYLHQGDLARGTAHFRVPIERGQDLMRILRGSVSGLCQPSYMLDIPGGHGKVPIGPSFLAPDGEAYWVEDYRGTRRRYRDG